MADGVGGDVEDLGDLGVVELAQVSEHAYSRAAMTSQNFRANVGIAVARADGLVLALERIDQPDRWQMPQGGLNVGEEPPEASLRELQEETGLRPEHVELVAERIGDSPVP